MNSAVKSSAVSEVTQSRNFNCTNVRNFQHTLDLTGQLLAVQLKLNVKLYVCGAPYSLHDIFTTEGKTIMPSRNRIVSVRPKHTVILSSYVCEVPF
jgi:hypothetical protein